MLVRKLKGLRICSLGTGCRRRSRSASLARFNTIYVIEADIYGVPNLAGSMKLVGVSGQVPGVRTTFISANSRSILPSHHLPSLTQHTVS